MGSLQYAILGLLNRKDMTGYDLTKEFQTTLSEFWSARHSQIYPELKTLTEAGLVQFQIEIAGNVMEKKLYTITEAGREKFEKWESTQCLIKATYKDEFLLKLFFSDCLSNEKRKEMLSDQLVQHRERLKHLQSNLGKFTLIPPDSEAELSDYFVLSGAIIREEGKCEWLEKCIQLCEK